MGDAGHPGASGPPPGVAAVGAIDIGSNSIHLTLARVRDGGAIETIARLKDPARLAGELDARNHLSAQGIERAVATLGRFRELAAVHGAHLRATATAAVRAARNADEFLHRAAHEAGVHVELISGHDEARLTYRGVRHGLPKLADDRILCVDSGGGSTELACGRGERVSLATSVAVGSLVISKRYLMPDPVHPRRVRQAQADIAKALAPHLAVVRRVGFDHAIATSGTIQRVARMAKVLAGDSRASRDVHGQRITAEAIDHVIERLTAAPTQAHRLCLPGMDPERADTLLGGALIFQALARGLDIQQWQVSMSALRTGLLLDIWQRAVASTVTAP